MPAKPNAKPAPKPEAPRRAVLINDELTQLTLLGGLLEQEGLQVQRYQDAQAALSEIRHQSPPDLIVTDLYMPGLDGWRLCRLLRSPEYRAFNQIPLIVVSATFAGTEAQALTADLGANAFVSIPFEPEEWHQVVQAVLAGKRHQQASLALIVDDDPPLTEMLRTVFQAHGYQTAGALSGEQALQRFSGRRPDIVLLDYHLPDVDGAQLLTEFKQLSPGTVVVMLTGDTSPELASKFMRLGASAYARKPVDPAYLVTLADRALRERSLLQVEDRLAERTTQLQVSEAKYRTLFNSMISGFVLHELLCDAQGKPYDFRFLDLNPAAETLLGFTRVQALGQTALALMPGLDSEWITRLGEVALTGKGLRFDHFLRPIDKHLLVVAFSPRYGQIAMTFVDITEQKHAQAQQERLLNDLLQAQSNVKVLSGLLPICTSCKKIRDDKGYWNQVEAYIQAHSEAQFTHGLCPDCAKKYFPDFT